MLKFKELVQQGDCTLGFAVFCSGGRFEMPPPWFPQECLPTAALWGRWGLVGRAGASRPGGGSAGG